MNAARPHLHRCLHPLDKDPVDRQLASFSAEDAARNPYTSHWMRDEIEDGRLLPSGPLALRFNSHRAAHIEEDDSRVKSAALVLCKGFHEGVWPLIRAGCTGGLENRAGADMRFFRTCR